MQFLSLDQEDPLEKEMATHSSILTWEILWTEEPGRVQSMVAKELDRTEWLNSNSKVSLNIMRIIVHHSSTFLCFAYPVVLEKCRKYYTRTKNVKILNEEITRWAMHFFGQKAQNCTLIF